MLAQGWVSSQISSYIPILAFSLPWHHILGFFICFCKSFTASLCCETLGLLSNLCSLPFWLVILHIELISVSFADPGKRHSFLPEWSSPTGQGLWTLEVRGWSLKTFKKFPTDMEEVKLEFKLFNLVKGLLGCLYRNIIEIGNSVETLMCTNDRMGARYQHILK